MVKSDVRRCVRRTIYGPIIWPPDAKSSSFEKDPDAEELRQEGRGRAEDEIWLGGITD